MSPLPCSVQIGPFTYEVRPTNNEDIIGETHNEELRIEIREGLPPQLEKETLLHEILHAIFFTLGLKTKMDEERIVETVSPILLDVIRRNPDLKMYLFE